METTTPDVLKARSEKPVVKDKDRDLLDHCLDDITIEEVKYYEYDDDENKIQIVITGSFSDKEEAKEFINNKTNKPVYDAYERAMRGIS